ncbi:MAG TPA: glycosyltransferase 87 family protein [Acidobacteriaceae bacterium]|nr:glycosyltransferase 87 family protein [Acidobacteriaceae bacterium]
MATAGTFPGNSRTSAFADLIIGVACGIVLVVTALFLAVLAQKGGLPSSCDFASYWATGQQLVHHANPWDASVMGNLERTAGYTGQGSYYMRNPPWALPLVFPLGWVSARTAVLPWSLLMLALLLLSVHLLRPVLGLTGWRLRLLGCCFPPALQCVVVGQTSLFVLLGLVLFLRFHRTRPVWAGAALWLCTLKPHLFLPFGVVLLLWIVLARGYRILAGAAAAAALSCLAALSIDPAAFSQYWQWAHASGISTQPVPCFGVLLRNLIAPGAEWLVFVPAAIACVWAVAYFWPRRRHWSWLDHGSLLMLVSILAAPYCFLFDQSLALPALLFAASRPASRRMLSSLAALYLLVELVPWFHFGPRTFFLSWLWQAPAWLVWYVLARRSHPPLRESAAPLATLAPTAG